MQGPSVFPGQWPAIYSLGDLHSIANGLAQELGGTWAREASDDDRGWMALTTTAGDVVYAYDSEFWWAEPSNSSPATHRTLLAGFLSDIGIDRHSALATAERVVANQVAGGRTCQWPDKLSIYTYQASDGDCDLPPENWSMDT